MDIGTLGASAGDDALGREVEDLVEYLASELGIGRCALHQGVQIIDVPPFGSGFCHDLLSQNVKGRHRRQDRVEPACFGCREQRSALDK